MKKNTTIASIILGFLLAGGIQASADTFGSGDNQFSIDFVTVENPGNGNDAGAGGGAYSSPYGKVDYIYKMGVHEISFGQVKKAIEAGLSNVESVSAAQQQTWQWRDTQPAAFVNWYEAAAFVNWLNTSNGHQAAYNLTWSGSSWSMTLWNNGDAWQQGGENLYRNKNTYYFLPSENEWYKAAYHKNDGTTSNYWDFATASNNIPDGIDFNGDTAFEAVYNQGYNIGLPNDVDNVGLASAYGTYGQTGNQLEIVESAYDGTNISATEGRTRRGFDFANTETYQRSSFRGTIAPTSESISTGFRVAAVPESSTWVLLIMAAAAIFGIRKFRKA